jgi:hypothetical protein
LAKLAKEVFLKALNPVKLYLKALKLNIKKKKKKKKTLKRTFFIIGPFRIEPHIPIGSLLVYKLHPLLVLPPLQAMEVG